MRNFSKEKYPDIIFEIIEKGQVREKLFQRLLVKEKKKTRSNPLFPHNGNRKSNGESIVQLYYIYIVAIRDEKSRVLAETERGN